MERINFDKYRIKAKNKKLCQTEWQEFARQTVETFGIDRKTFGYQKIFQMSKKNLLYLKAKVEKCNSKFCWENEQIEEKNKVARKYKRKEIKKKKISEYAGLLIWLIINKK